MPGNAQVRVNFILKESYINRKVKQAHLTFQSPLHMQQHNLQSKPSQWDFFKTTQRKCAAVSCCFLLLLLMLFFSLVVMLKHHPSTVTRPFIFIFARVAFGLRDLKQQWSHVITTMQELNSDYLFPDKHNINTSPQWQFNSNSANKWLHFACLQLTSVLPRIWNSVASVSDLLEYGFINVMHEWFPQSAE